MKFNAITALEEAQAAARLKPIKHCEFYAILDVVDQWRVGDVIEFNGTNMRVADIGALEIREGRAAKRVCLTEYHI